MESSSATNTTPHLRVLDPPFKDKDSIMADKGFTISDLLHLGVSLNLSPFLGGSNQMPAEDVVQTQEIASLRIHIEQAINKIENLDQYQYLGNCPPTPPLTQQQSIDKKSGFMLG